MFNVLRGAALFLGPLVGYLVGKSNSAALIGLGVAALIVALELIFDRIPLDVLFFGLLGGAAGLAMARVFDWGVFQLENPIYYRWLSKYTVLVNLFAVYLGCMIAVRKKSELDLLDRNVMVKGRRNKDSKVIDTSVLIDGRLADIAETGFLSGVLVVPRFVLHELQMIADSADATRRQRGRRGLDILKRLQDCQDVSVKIYDKDFPHIKEVDAKILELAKELDAKVATTDFNLSKVAALQGINVLNVNDLAGALKSVVLPGDSLTIYLAKEGKERAQAVGYLDDGTMIVVDEGRRHIGKRVGVYVNSILQTPAGRMIFARIQEGRGETPVEEKPHPTSGEEQAAPSFPA